MLLALNESEQINICPPWNDQKTIGFLIILRETDVEPFTPNATFLLHLKTSLKGCIGNKWVNKRNDKCFNNRGYSLYFSKNIFLKHLWLISDILKWQSCKILIKLAPSQTSSRSSHQRRCSLKKVLLNILQISQGNTCVGVSFNKIASL